MKIPSANEIKNHAGNVFDTMQKYVETAKGSTLNAVASGKATINELAHYTPERFVNDAREVGGALYRTSPADVAELADATVGQSVRNGYGWARDKSSTVLNDLDAFYHNADGSYNRTKVGATIGAGLGIAGIAGYNMNN